MGSLAAGPEACRVRSGAAPVLPIENSCVLPERRVTVHSEDMGYTIGLFAGEQNALEGV